MVSGNRLRSNSDLLPEVRASGKTEQYRQGANLSVRIEKVPAIRSVLISSLLFVSVILPIHCLAQTPAGSQPPDPIQPYLQGLVDRHALAGAVTLVATRDRVIYLQPVGYRDLAAKAPMPANALFWIASTSKPMTVTAFMMLVDEGKVSLDDPVEKYLPEFHHQMVKASTPEQQPSSPASSNLVAANHPILVREILSHTSGLPFKSAAQPGALDTLSLKDLKTRCSVLPLSRSTSSRERITAIPTKALIPLLGSLKL
jgi:CubicO group peptidase (beta-lactamase class C family)